MKQAAILFLLIQMALGAFCQENTMPTPWSMQASLGQFPARIAVPDFSAIHPGIHLGVMRQWNKDANSQIVQSAQLGYFFHRDVQHAVQLYTEIGYRIKFNNGLAFTPLMLGGGYVLSVSDLNTVRWNPSSEQYERVGFPARNNWMISLGSTLSLETKLQIFPNRNTTFFLDYRLQVQGIFIKNTVPVIAYTPLKLGISIPFEVKKGEKNQ